MTGRETYYEKVRREVAKPLPVCKHEETKTVVTPEFDKVNGTVIDSIEETRCTNCGRLVGFAS